MELPNKPHLLPHEVQAFLGISRTTLYKWLEEGVIPYRKIGGKLYRIPRNEFIAWYEKQESALGA